MRKTLLTAFLLIAAGHASAEWTVFEQDDTSASYIDKSSIRRSGQTVKAWFLFNNAAQQSLDGHNAHTSVVTLFEFDCADQKVRVLQGAAHKGPMGEGPISFSTTSPQPWQYIAPNSFQTNRLKLVCKR